MTPSLHLSILGQAVAAWLAFWLIGLPDYYQQYSVLFMGPACVVLSVAISLLAIWLLKRGRPETRRARAFWFSVYGTVPLALLDTLYCGIYLGRGWAYLHEYWYLTVFYFSVWMTFLPTAALLDRMGARATDQG